MPQTLISGVLLCVAFWLPATAQAANSVVAMGDLAPTCRPYAPQARSPVVPVEIFPEVIVRTPGGDAGARQLFEPLRSVGEPLARLGAACLHPAHAESHTACDDFADWIARLVAADALRFDRERHSARPVSRVTGALAGNLVLRPIVLHVSVLHTYGRLTLKNKPEFNTWVARRINEYRHLPIHLVPAAAQNLALHATLTALLAEQATSQPAGALDDARRLYRLYLDSARADGSFPQETRRGASALKYSAMAAGALLSLVEIAGAAGDDWLDYRAASGVDLHHTISFVVAAIDDPTRIARYAHENYAPTDHAPPGHQSLRFMKTDMAWLHRYATRFPGRVRNASFQRVLARIPSPRLGAYDMLTGRITGCQY